MDFEKRSSAVPSGFKEHLPSIGMPAGAAAAGRKIGELSKLPPFCIHEKNIPSAVSVRLEGDPLPVGRVAGVAVVARVVGEVALREGGLGGELA